MNITKGEALANARLIVAAPKMLEALKEMVKYFGKYPNFVPSPEYTDQYMQAQKDACTAIALAEEGRKTNMVITNCPALKTTTSPGMSCTECQNLLERRREDERIAENMRDYWSNIQNGNE